jgi:hypothetical protein
MLAGMTLLLCREASAPYTRMAQEIGFAASLAGSQLSGFARRT